VTTKIYTPSYSTYSSKHFLLRRFVNIKEITEAEVVVVVVEQVLWKIFGL
jgi:hypothetical protein